LSYHRVLAEPDSLLPGEPDVAAFARQVKALAGLCNVISLPEAARRLSRRDLPPRAASLTFDDGYRNNLELAAPVLQCLGIPATIFITQQAVESGVLWNDRVIESIRHASERVDLSVVGLGQVIPAGPEQRAGLIATVLRGLKYRPMQERSHLVSEFCEANRAPAPPRLMLTEADVRTLSDSGFDIGGHTVSHPILAMLPPEDARREIEDGAAWIAGVIGRRPISFAYPNGRPGRDFDEGHERMVRDAGFELAVSTAWGCATGVSNVFALPRVGFSETGDWGMVSRLARTYVDSYR